MKNFFNLSKKLLESSKLIEQLETENRLLQQQKALQAPNSRGDSVII